MPPLPQEYCLAKPPTANKVRFGRLLLLLPSIYKYSQRSLETLFFKRTLGNISVERLIVDLSQVRRMATGETWKIGKYVFS